MRYTSPQEDTSHEPRPGKAHAQLVPQVNPDEPWTGRCGKEKIAEDAKRHRCHKKEKHYEPVHACNCSLEWKQF